MQTVAQTMAPPGRAQRRLAGLFFALLLQVGLITALVIGLDIKVWPTPEVGIVTRFIPGKKVVLPPPRPINNTFLEPKTAQPIEPKIIFDNGQDDGTAINPNPGPRFQPGPNDHGPIGIMATHTTPPYPPLAIRLGQEGTVMLRLAISPQGVVTDAAVARSSGYPLLDEAARVWVLAHWRYQGAVRGGAAAPATTTIGVVFDLKNAG